MADAAQIALMYFVLPLWIAVGFADWLCHRVSQIERTAGPQETVFHLLGLAEFGVAVLCVLLFEINALVIAVMLGAFAIHAVTVWLDVRYATKTREIMPIEQTVHNYLEGIPLLGLGIIVLLHWNQFLALFGFGPEAADFALRWKAPPLPAVYLVSVIMAVLVFNVVPFVEELVRGLRARRAPTA
jgi:hypothetical protein